MKKVIVLDSIRSMQNVGAIFRNADGSGFEKLYLC
jgi:tRNA G18 (ribose-2'-O)-methylase SpoU